MKRHVVNVCAVLAAVLFLSVSVLQLTAEARIGGSRSFGSRGSRSYSKPAGAYSQPSPSRQQFATPFQQQAGGGFMRGLAGGIMGGMLGSMLFGGTAGAGAGASGTEGGGIGLFEIALLGGGGYLLYRIVRRKES